MNNVNFSVGIPIIIVYSIMTFCMLFICIRLYYLAARIWCSSYVCLIDKTVIVTGCTSGMGVYIAMDFAKRGANVILACRNRYKGDVLRKHIVEKTRNKRIIVKELDLCSFKSVQVFAEDIKKKFNSIYILVNNAGIHNIIGTTVDGFNITMQTNYLSPVLLTILLLEPLRNAKGRIVNVTDDMAIENGVLTKLDTIRNPTKIYDNSKLALILFTNFLARKMEYTGINVFAVSPGPTKTTSWKKKIYRKRFIENFNNFFLHKEPECGAQVALFAALEKYIEKYNGQLFDESAEVVYVDDLYNNERECLWGHTETLLPLTERDKSFLYLIGPD